MRSILVVIAIALVAIGISIATQPRKDLTPNVQEREEAKRRDPSLNPPTGGPTVMPAADEFQPPREGAITAVMRVKDRGEVTFELYPRAAPKTVAQIKDLIGRKFYDGIKFHRVEPGFVVQCGDPKTRDMAPDRLAKMGMKEMQSLGIGGGGSGHPIPFEQNSLAHVTGSLGIALSAAQTATGDSQFFINTSNNHSLDGNYCVFGKVTQGLDTVGKIQRGDAIESITLK